MSAQTDKAHVSGDLAAQAVALLDRLSAKAREVHALRERAERAEAEAKAHLRALTRVEAGAGAYLAALTRVVAEVRFVLHLTRDRDDPSEYSTAWWVADHEEAETYRGPYKTRDLAIASTDGEGFVFQGRRSRLSLADYLPGIDYLVDWANAVAEELGPPDGSPVFALDAAQGARMLEAIRAWQTSEGLEFYASSDIEVVGEMEPIEPEPGEVVAQ